jgi:hypothetical protein
MIKDLQNIGIEGRFLNIIEAKCDKSVASTIISGGKLKPFPLKSGIS